LSFRSVLWEDKKIIILRNKDSTVFKVWEGAEASLKMRMGKEILDNLLVEARYYMG